MTWHKKPYTPDLTYGDTLVSSPSLCIHALLYTGSVTSSLRPVFLWPFHINCVTLESKALVLWFLHWDGPNHMKTFSLGHCEIKGENVEKTLGIVNNLSPSWMLGTYLSPILVLFHWFPYDYKASNGNMGICSSLFYKKRNWGKQSLIIYLKLQDQYELKLGLEYWPYALNHEATVTLELPVITSLLLEVEFKACSSCPAKIQSFNFM